MLNVQAFIFNEASMRVAAVLQPEAAVSGVQEGLHSGHIASSSQGNAERQTQAYSHLFHNLNMRG